MLGEAGIGLAFDPAGLMKLRETASIGVRDGFTSQTCEMSQLKEREL